MDKIIVIGSVAAGTSAAAKARRNDESVEITIYDKDNFISYAGCGTPYYIGGEVGEIEALTPRNPMFFKSRYNIDVFAGYEVIQIDRANKNVKVKNLETSEVIVDSYDKLIISTGANALIPQIKNIEKNKVFALRNIKDAVDIKLALTQEKPKNVVISGSGFIGFELLENLVELGISVSMIELSDKITPFLDKEMSKMLENLVVGKGITIRKETSIVEFTEDKAILSNGEVIDCDMAIISVGVKPNTQIAKDCGLELGIKDAIKVNKKMQTSDENIYACGDCIETYNQINGKACYRPLGSTANKTGRIAGENVTGGDIEYRGNLGTCIFKFNELSVGATGFSEEEARAEGYDVVVCHNLKPDRAEYMGGKDMAIKAIADRKSSKLLGVQIVGYDGVDKRLDVFATLLTYGAKVEELFHLDLSYAPPFSTAKDPVHSTGMILDNAINKGRDLITLEELNSIKEKYQLVDTRNEDDIRTKGMFDGAVNITLGQLHNGDIDLDKNIPIVVYCNKGIMANAAQNILINKGFKNVKNLSGGQVFYKASK